MEPLQYAGISPEGASPPTAFVPGSRADRSSRFWRTVWRTHFYAGMFAIPVVVLLALTGLVILYTEPINELFDGRLRKVSPGREIVSLDRQRAAVDQRFPSLRVATVTTPRSPDRATVFSLTADDVSFTDAYVNPYTGKLIGSKRSGVDLVGLANRLHGSLNSENLTVAMPSIEGMLGAGPAFMDVAVGEIVLEIVACWALVLAVSGIYLWWPRKKDTGKALFVPRIAKKGRARWRDLHAVPGIALSLLLVFFVTSGLPWSAFWGENFSYVASKVTPGHKPEVSSVLATVGDLDRFGNRIPWATQAAEVPASGAGSHHGDKLPRTPVLGKASAAEHPAVVSLDAIHRIAAQEKMKAGYSIALPADEKGEGDEQVYGTFVLANPWPDRLHRSRTVFVDQFSGATLGTDTPANWGGLDAAASFGVQTHMGTQYGLATRIAMTFGALALLWSVLTAIVMWWKRRPKGKAGLPRRPSDSRLPKGLLAIVVGLAAIYPLWGASALAVVLLDRLVIRRLPKLRSAFGMR